MPLIALRENTRTIQRPWSGRPRHPFAVNRDSEQFQGLVAWWPCMPFLDLIDVGPSGRFRLTRNGPIWVADKEMGAVPEFDDASSQYFESNIAVVTGYSFMMACWLYCDDLGTAPDQTLMWIGDKDVANHYHYLDLQVATDVIAASSRAGGAPASATTSSSISVNAWHHACGVFTSATNRAAFLDGGSKGTNATSRTPSGLDRTTVGRLGDSTPSEYWSGRVADARIYNRAPTDAEVYRQWHPNTRWELYYPLGRKTYVFFPTAGGQVFAQTLTATAILAADRSSLVELFRTLSAQAVGTASITKLAELFRTISAAAIGAATLSTARVFAVALAAAAVMTATLSRTAESFRTLSAANIGSAALTRTSVLFRTLSAQAVGQAGLSRVAEFFRSLGAAATGSATLTRVAELFRTLSATASGAASAARVAELFRTLAAAGLGAASVVATFASGAVQAAAFYLEQRISKMVDLMRRESDITDTTKRQSKNIDPMGRESGKKGHRR